MEGLTLETVIDKLEAHMGTFTSDSFVMSTFYLLDRWLQAYPEVPIASEQKHLNVLDRQDKLLHWLEVTIFGNTYPDYTPVLLSVYLGNYRYMYLGDIGNGTLNLYDVSRRIRLSVGYLTDTSTKSPETRRVLQDGFDRLSRSASAFTSGVYGALSEILADRSPESEDEDEDTV